MLRYLKNLLNRPLFLPTVLIFLVVFLTMAFVYHRDTGWNVNTRLDLVFAVVDRGTLTIDDLHEVPPYATDDKAFFGGHYYSDKIFGVSLLAAPFYWIAQVLSGHQLSFHGAHYLMKVCAVALPGGISAALFFLLLCFSGTGPKKAVLLTGLCVYGTMWFGYGTVFYPYMPGLAACLGALYLTLYPLAHRLTGMNCYLIGLLLGYALLCDLTFALVVLGLGVIWLLRVVDQCGFWGLQAFAQMKGPRDTKKELFRYSVVFWVGVFTTLSLFFLYSYSIFGRFAVPYEYEFSDRFREGMAEGLMGVTLPKLHALYFITVHPFRGLFFWSPIFLFGVLGSILAIKRPGKRSLLGILGIWCFFSYLIFNSGYYMWWGGWCMGPRIMMPMIPFVLLGLGEFTRIDWSKNPLLIQGAFWALIGVGVVSLALTLPLSLYDPQIPQGNQDQVLANASMETKLEVPHFTVLKMFYGGYLTLNPLTRIEHGQLTDNRVGNALQLLAFLFVIGASFILAVVKCPEKLPQVLRMDFPVKTLDGSAGPPPPGLPR